MRTGPIDSRARELWLLRGTLAFSVALMSVVGVVVYQTVHRVEESTQAVGRVQDVLGAIRTTAVTSVNAQSAANDYLLFGDDHSLESFSLGERTIPSGRDLAHQNDMKLRDNRGNVSWAVQR